MAGLGQRAADLQRRALCSRHAPTCACPLPCPCPPLPAGHLAYNIWRPILFIVAVASLSELLGHVLHVHWSHDSEECEQTGWLGGCCLSHACRCSRLPAHRWLRPHAGRGAPQRGGAWRRHARAALRTHTPPRLPRRRRPLPALAVVTRSFTMASFVLSLLLSVRVNIAFNRW